MRNRTLRLVAIILVSATLLTTSCAQKATFEQKRSDVVTYLRAFNTIENSFGETISQVALPRSSKTAANLIAFNAAITRLLTAYDGAISRLAELKPSSLETSTNTHLQQARFLYQSQRSLVNELRDAIAIGNATSIAQKVTELAAADSATSSMNRDTEQLMLQFNISDTEVNYRFRGK